MIQHFPGLHTLGGGELPTGNYLVRVQHARYRAAVKPFFSIKFEVLQPADYVGEKVFGRIYCTPKALWKLNWFLREFGYEADLLKQDAVDEKRLAGLRGIIRISKAQVNGNSYLNIDGFAPAGAWESVLSNEEQRREVAS